MLPDACAIVGCMQHSNTLIGSWTGRQTRSSMRPVNWSVGDGRSSTCTLLVDDVFNKTVQVRGAFSSRTDDQKRRPSHCRSYSSRSTIQKVPLKVSRNRSARPDAWLRWTVICFACSTIVWFIHVDLTQWRSDENHQQRNFLTIKVFLWFLP